MQLYPSDPQLRAEVLQLERTFSEQLGVWTRVMAYSGLFGSPTHLAQEVLGQRMAPWKRRLLRAVFPFLKGALLKGFKVTPDNVAHCQTQVEVLFERMSARLADGRQYLVGDTFTAADLTFAAMSAIVLGPPEYGAKLGVMESSPPWTPVLRATPAGQHALRMYSLHRRPLSQGSVV